MSDPEQRQSSVTHAGISWQLNLPPTFLTYQLPFYIPNPSCGQVCGQGWWLGLAYIREQRQAGGEPGWYRQHSCSFLPPLLLPKFEGPEAWQRVMLCQQEGKRRESASGEPKSVHCPQDSLTFPLGLLLSGVSGVGLGLGECITLNVFPPSLDTGP